MFLSAGEARTELLDTPVTCEGIGVVDGTPATCLPMQKDLFDISAPYVVSDLSAGGDPVFTIIADETKITMSFPDPVGPNDLNDIGFRLTDLDSVQALFLGSLPGCTPSRVTDCVTFLDWNDDPSTRPEITIDGAGVQTLEWTVFAGGEAETGSVIVIRPLPEPSAAAVTAVALATVGLIRQAARRRRPFSLSGDSEKADRTRLSKAR